MKYFVPKNSYHVLTTSQPTGVIEPPAPSPPPQPSFVPRSSSQPAPASKNVAFDLGSDGSEFSSPDLRRHRRRGETSRGYEAEDDSESTLDGRDKRYPTHHPVSETESNPEISTRRRKHHRRQREDRRSQRPQPSSRSQPHAHDRSQSPTGSDSTVDLPERFDREGRKKPERGEDLVVDLLEDLLAGKGPGGKYFKKMFGGADDDVDEAGGRRRRG